MDSIIWPLGIILYLFSNTRDGAGGSGKGAILGLKGSNVRKCPTIRVAHSGVPVGYKAREIAGGIWDGP